MAAQSTPAAAQPFKPPPDDLKLLSPFLQRAHETRKADPALAYWCNYHAAQLGISRASSLSPTSRAFLLSLMDTLEEQKKALAGNDIVHGDDLVAKAHVENVALKVFGGADNEDRTGKATRATARRFLVAGNFIEVLTNFGKLDPEMEEKLKYAKWKAADIAKAFREGRQPTPGPIGGLDPEEEEEEAFGGAQEGEQVDPSLAGIEAASARLGGLSADTGPLPSRDELDAEMAKLTAQESGEPDDTEPVAISPQIEPPTPQRPGMDDAVSSRRRTQSRLSYDGWANSGGLSAASDGLGDLGRGSPLGQVGSPNFSKPIRISRQGSANSDELTLGNTTDVNGSGSGSTDTQSAFFQYSQGRIPSSGTASPHPRPLPQPPGQSASTVRAGLPAPPTAHQGGFSPNIAPIGLSPGLPPTDSLSPFPSFQQPSVQQQPTPSAPPAASMAPAAAATAPPATADPASFPNSLTLAQTGRVQKLAKWAVSALDYEDLATARKQLREALDICEGRTPSSAYTSK